MLLKNYLHIGAVALKTGSKCSFIGHKLRFSPCYCHVSAVSNTFANSLSALLHLPTHDSPLSLIQTNSHLSSNFNRPGK
jgi:hypothetical protein